MVLGNCPLCHVLTEIRSQETLFCLLRRSILSHREFSLAQVLAMHLMTSESLGASGCSNSRPALQEDTYSWPRSFLDIFITEFENDNESNL